MLIRIQRTFIHILFVILSGLYGQFASAVSIDWSGGYRFEWMELDRPSLSPSPTERKAYGLHYLYLTPRIIASDGVNIYSRFDIFSSRDPAYQNSQAGDIWGGGLPASPNPSDARDVDTSRSNTTGRNERANFMKVSQLYVTLNQENGILFMGRMPLEFGLGMTYNLGNGPFDHWTNSRDLVGFKFIVDNLFFMPMLGRMYDADYGQGNSVQDEMLQVQYENKDSGNLLGFIYEKRKAAFGVNDTPVAPLQHASSPGTLVGDYSVQRTNFILGKSWTGFGFKFEASFLSGDTGIRLNNGTNVKMNGYGLATELYFPDPDAKWHWTVRGGMATGDDPTTEDYEGFQFDRNYDVAFLMFNHRLGSSSRDFFTTDLIKDKTAGRNNANSIDDEAIGNAMYLSPRLKYDMAEKWDLYNTVTVAQLITNPSGASDVSKHAGFEYDIELVYRPRERLMWSNVLGLLFPGPAFADGKSNLDNSNTYGLSSRIAISF